MLENIKENIKENIDSTGDYLKNQVKRRPFIKRLLGKVYKFCNDINKDNISLYAGQSAFFTILSAVPFLMLVIFCIKYIISADILSIISMVSKAFPDPVSTYVRRIIIEVFYKTDSLAVLSVTIVSALWSASRGTMAIYSGLNNLFGYTKTDNWFASRIISFFYTILFVLVIAATIVVLVFGNAILTFADSEFKVAHYVLLILFRNKIPIFFVLFVLAFASLYSFLPQKKMKFAKQLPGAVATAIGWIGFSYGFSIYVMHFSRYSFLYGSITAIMLLMLWTYFCIYMLLLGAEINKHIEQGFFKGIYKKPLMLKKRKK